MSSAQWNAPDIAESLYKLRQNPDFATIIRMVGVDAEDCNARAIYGKTREDREAGAYETRALARILDAYQNAERVLKETRNQS